MAKILNFFKSSKKPAEVKPTQTKFHLLVVEDTLELIEVLKLAQFPEHYKITMATSGYEAVTLLNAGGVDAVLADINMPDMELLNKELNQRANEIPVFRMSGQYNHFVNLVLKKPFGIKEYQSAVHQLYGLSKALKRAS